MHKLQTEILVIGGGATGAGILRDLALRGFQAILVERRDLTDGTTGRYHGLLHSGARYAVKDPLAARECIEENRILRRIMPTCIEDTGGYFVTTPGDDPAYADRLMAGCQAAGIPIEDVPIAAMLRREPLLNPAITRCLRVPDGAADSFLATRLNARDAEAHGALVLRYHPVQNLLISQQGAEKRVTGALCRDLVSDEDVQISADLVINAAGAWAGKIAATAGITVQMTPGKGVMLAANHRIVNTVINRCKMPGDGDILVPAHTVAVIGTTDVKVPDPDHFGIEAWEVDLMLSEGEKLIPGFAQMRFLRAWAGVRPLYQETVLPSNAQNRDITRAFVLLDHASRDGIPGLLTITGGKWTTYRKMAEITVDRVCERLNTPRPCRTHLQPVEDRNSKLEAHHYLGHRLAEVEHGKAYGQLVCECELATLEDVRQAITAGQAHSLDDIRREVRLGKGPCQAGFCTLRAAGILHSLVEGQTLFAVETRLNTNAALRDFLEERWKGVRPVLWGQQLRQERLNELIYLNLLNISALPGPAHTPLAAAPYAAPAPATERPPQSPTVVAQATIRNQPAPGTSSDVLVVGAGLAGLFCAWQCAKRGLKVKLIAKGAGTTHWASGCIDLLGYFPLTRQQPVASPQTALAELRQAAPRHPYALFGEAALAEAIADLQALCETAGYPLPGGLERNWLLPTAAGSLRPTGLAPTSFIAGDAHRTEAMLIVGFAGLLDFFPHFAAANLCAQGLPAEAILLDLPTLNQPLAVNGMKLARLFETPAFRREVVEALRPHLGQAQRVGFPAVLGLKNAPAVLADLQAQLGRPIFEMPGLPPSIPGIRLYELLTAAIRQAGGQVFEGMQAIGGVTAANGRRLEAIQTESAGRPTRHQAGCIVLATGGILGGGILTRADGQVREAVLGLPVTAPASRLDWLAEHFLSASGQPIFRAGLLVNQHGQPLDDAGQPFFENLYAVGSLLGGCDPVRERSLEGLCLVSGLHCAQELTKVNGNERVCV
jgi:glycerol-3-phosphate dehydrogenase